MEQNVDRESLDSPFYLGYFLIEPDINRISQGSTQIYVQPKVMDVLIFFCSNPNRLISSDELIEACWGSQYVSDNPVHKCIAQVRKLLNDSARNPTFIKTVPRKGYIFLQSPKFIELYGAKVDLPLSNSSYSKTESHLYFGRDEVVNKVLAHISALPEYDVPWLSISASVGSGKTSLLHAGIIPKLNDLGWLSLNGENEFVLFDLKVPDSNKPPHINLLNNLIAKDYLKSDVNLTCEGGPASLKDSILSSNAPLLIVIDHLEEIFDALKGKSKNRGEITPFFSLLQQLVESRRFLIITLTSSHFLNQIDKVCPIHKSAVEYKTPPFSHCELATIVTQTATTLNLTFEYCKNRRESLDVYISSKVFNEQIPIRALKLILVALTQKAINGVITFRLYEQEGGVEGALARVAEETFFALETCNQDALRFILPKLLDLESSGQAVFAAEQSGLEVFSEKSELCLIDALLKANVLKASSNGDLAKIEFSHPSLITKWERVKEWINQNVEFLYVRYDLRVATERWLNHEKNSSYLIFAEKKLDTLNQLRKVYQGLFSTHEIEFIRATRAQHYKQKRIKRVLSATFLMSFVAIVTMFLQVKHKNTQLIQSQAKGQDLISFILEDINQKLRPIGKLDLLDMVANKGLSYYESVAPGDLNDKALSQWIEALHIKGEVHLGKGNIDEAKKKFLEAKRLLRAYSVGSIKSERHIELEMLSSYWIGYVYYMEGEYEISNKFMTEYLDLAKSLRRNFPSEKWELEVSYALNNLGSLAEMQGDLALAQSLFSESALVKRKLLDSDPTNQTLILDLADTKSWQANVFAANGELDKEAIVLEQSLSLVKPLYLSTEDFDVALRLAGLEHNLALNMFAKNSLMKAVVLSEEVVTKLKVLSENDDENTNVAEELLWSMILNIKLLNQLKKYDLAMVTIEDAKSVLNKLEAKEVSSEKVIRASIEIAHQQALSFFSLAQKESALRALKLSFQRFHGNIDYAENLELYGRILISKELMTAGLSKEETSSLLASMSLQELVNLIEKKLSTGRMNYKLVGLLLEVESKFSVSIKRGEWLELYQKSDYDFPINAVH